MERIPEGLFRLEATRKSMAMGYLSLLVAEYQSGFQFQ